MRTKIVLTFVVALAVILIGSFLFLKGGSRVLGEAKVSSWYAVHLNNDVTYFGHLSRISRDKMVLSDAYSIEKFTAGDSTISESKNFAVQQAPKEIYQLMRRGDEKSLATDHTMFINRSSVLFWEKLSADSDIVASINATIK